MQVLNPPHTDQIRTVIEERLAALESIKGAQETVTVEWRGTQRHIPVISMPVELLFYNPGTHRICAQRSIDTTCEQALDTDPFGQSAQGYLHRLLMGDPADPAKTDQSFIALKDDLSEHGQSEPGIITRAGVLINGNTRRAALKELGQSNMRVGVLPPDAGLEDLQTVELSLQLRKDHKRDYSFMNFLLAIDERVAAGQLPANIQTAFRIKATTYERSRWILESVRDAIERSKVRDANKQLLSLRLVDFETHQGKLEELYRAYCALQTKSPDDADALREQRLLGLALDKSKTDLRLIEKDFVQRYMPDQLHAMPAAPPVKIPGTSITARGPSQEVQALRQLTTSALRAKAVEVAPGETPPSEAREATEVLRRLNESMDKALDRAGKQGRVVKKRFAATDRLSDACDELALAVNAVAEARATGNFNAEDLDEILVTLKINLDKLAAIILRGSDSEVEGIAWLRAMAKVNVTSG
jgi:ParB-like chromosome segregation protein Spo0J